MDLDSNFSVKHNDRHVSGLLSLIFLNLHPSIRSKFYHHKNKSDFFELTQKQSLTSSVRSLLKLIR